jgi:isocitrate dehydrogenase
VNHLTTQLINLIIADHFDGYACKCSKFKATMKVEDKVIKDVEDTFKNWGYAMAKGVFVNEVMK